MIPKERRWQIRVPRALLAEPEVKPNHIGLYAVYTELLGAGGDGAVPWGWLREYLPAGLTSKWAVRSARTWLHERGMLYFDPGSGEAYSFVKLFDEGMEVSAERLTTLSGQPSAPVSGYAAIPRMLLYEDGVAASWLALYAALAYSVSYSHWPRTGEVSPGSLMAHSGIRGRNLFYAVRAALTERGYLDWHATRRGVWWSLTDVREPSMDIPVPQIPDRRNQVHRQTPAKPRQSQGGGESRTQASQGGGESRTQVSQGGGESRIQTPQGGGESRDSSIGNNQRQQSSTTTRENKQEIPKVELLEHMPFPVAVAVTAAHDRFGDEQVTATAIERIWAKTTSGATISSPQAYVNAVFADIASTPDDTRARMLQRLAAMAADPARFRSERQPGWWRSAALEHPDLERLRSWMLEIGPSVPLDERLDRLQATTAGASPPAATEAPSGVCPHERFAQVRGLDGRRLHICVACHTEWDPDS